MSILLDSLRKSEAQRKGRDAPTIHSAEEYGGSSRRPASWVAVAMAGVAAAAIIWFGGRQYSAPGEDAGASRITATEQTAQPDGSRRGQRRPAAPTSGTADQVRTPVERLPAPAPESSGGEESATAADRIAGYVVEEGDGYAFEEEEEPEPDSASGQVDEDLIGVDNPDDFAEFQRAAPEQPESTGVPESEPRSYWQLPQSWRSEMPEFRITVLVYAEAPEDRFLLMNGERVREGDEVEGGVVLEEIRRDGAVFSYRQTRFLVKS